MTEPPKIDRKNVQGDILVGFNKKFESFYFFRIVSVPEFKSQLLDFKPSITTVEGALEQRETVAQFKRENEGLLTVSAVNIAFSNKGINKLGITGDANNLNDGPFATGMSKDAAALGDAMKDKDTPDWDAGFLNDIHGVFLVAGDSKETVDETVKSIEGKFTSAGTSSIEKVHRVDGKTRPEEHRHEEHFGFRDGISQPAVIGFDVTDFGDTKALPGQGIIQPGIILVGHPGDNTKRPLWATDGSFLAFRKLKQNVPEFNKFVNEHKLPKPNGAELLGARLVGRWKSGAPIEKSPEEDNKKMAEDNQQNNDFLYKEETQKDAQKNCPFSAHIRKTHPRIKQGDTEQRRQTHRIIRRGIPYGEEVQTNEIDTTEDRGLLFVSYQSKLDRGFRFIQQQWSNSPGFPTFSVPQPGFDPITGQSNNSTVVRQLTGQDLSDESLPLPLEQWVFSRGGEYFFSPSLDAIEHVFAAN